MNTPQTNKTKQYAGKLPKFIIAAIYNVYMANMIKKNVEKNPAILKMVVDVE